MVAPAADIQHILDHTRELWRDLAGARIFITGGTGFYGRWLLASLTAAYDRLGARLEATVLTRSAKAFAAAAPELAAHPALTFVEGDVRSFTPPGGDFSHIIHAATPASAAFNDAQPMAMFDTIVGGTRRVLNFAANAGTSAVLLCSSGAIYGRQPPELDRMPEDFPGGPNPLDIRNAYAEGKRVSEFLAVASGLDVKIARGYAFVGPHLPLDAHFAIGNFLGDALAGRDIRISGDGSPYRSYLHAADLAIWLWTILLRGAKCRAYNTGSEQAVSIGELADTVRRVVAPAIGVQIAGQRDPDRLPERYVPNCDRARTELGLEVRIPLEEAIARTAAWHRRG